MSDLLTAVDARPDYSRWSRKNRTLIVWVAGNPARLLARVQRVRRGVWRAVMMPTPHGAQQCSPSFKRMEEACAWAQERLGLYELATLE